MAHSLKGYYGSFDSAIHALRERSLTASELKELCNAIGDTYKRIDASYELLVKEVQSRLGLAGEQDS